MDLSLLNSQQQKVVKQTQGPVLVLAGAGSGKTKALTSRIAYLIDELNVSPYEIIALTFTNKAAKEMRERIEAMVGPNAQYVWTSTFHSTCAKMLRIDIDKIGYEKQFVIYDDTDQLSLISDIQKILNISEDIAPKRLIRSIISDAKNKSLNPAEYIQAREGNSELNVRFFEEYQRQLKKNNALDFDDLMIKTLELFNKVPEVLEKYQRRFRYIHVDEYQDTNIVQYKLVRLLADYHKNICVVGDDDQSIYGWRGADIRNILGFEEDFDNTVVIRLEQNYRSVGNILDAANAVIKNNIDRKQKKLWTNKPKGEKIDLYTAYSDRDEADFIARTITENNTNGIDYAKHAVLYRTNAQSRVIEESMVGYGIPYVVYGSLRFYDRKEIKDILAYLRIIVNPVDDVSLRRIINVPKRGIGEASVTQLSKCAEELNISLYDALLNLDELPLAQKTKDKLAGFINIMVNLRALRELLSASELVKQLLDMIDYWSYLEEESKKDGKSEQRRENAIEFMNAVSEFEQSSEENSLELFLENVALVANVKDENTTNSVTLMTLHSSKGLEYPYIFMAGLEKNLFPSSRANNNPQELEEERRLCYVGITRAQQKLYISWAKTRMKYRDFANNLPSEFLEELPENLINKAKKIQASDFGANIKSGMGYTNTGKSNISREAKAEIFSRNISVDAPPKRNNIAFKVDDKIMHEKFGNGVIKEISGTVLTIDFEMHGVKKIVGSYAPIKKS